MVGSEIIGDRTFSSRIAIVGGSGFVGRAMTAHLAGSGIPVTVVSRTALSVPSRDVTYIRVSGYADDKIRLALAECETAIYLAARAHVLDDRESNPLAAFRQANRDTPLAFVDQTAGTGLRRLVFVSTIGVNGAATGHNPFCASDPPRPHSPYAQSKLEAELGLRDRCAERGVELVIVRPPLVYGAGAPGNFARLVQLVRSGIPLPFGTILNRRSLIGIDNLCDLLKTAAIHPAAAGHVLLAADGEDLSTSDLLRGLYAASGRRSRLFPMPTAILRKAVTMAGSDAMATQLLDSLRIDASPTRSLLEWCPPLTVAQGLQRCFENDR